MGLFESNRPDRYDLCACQHMFIEHDSLTKFCVKRRCTCMDFIPARGRGYVRQPISEDSGKMDSEESGPTGGTDGN